MLHDFICGSMPHYGVGMLTAYACKMHRYIRFTCPCACMCTCTYTLTCMQMYTHTHTCACVNTYTTMTKYHGNSIHTDTQARSLCHAQYPLAAPLHFGGKGGHRMPYAWMPVRPVGCRWVGDSSHKPLCMCCHFGCVCVCVAKWPSCGTVA